MLHASPTSHKLAEIDQLSAQKEEKWQKKQSLFYLQDPGKVYYHPPEKCGGAP